MIHVYEQRVYYSDTDCGGIVYHARYLDFAEHARTEMLRQIAEEHNLVGEQSTLVATMGVAFVVKQVSVDYHKPAYLDDFLRVESRAERVKRFSIDFVKEVYRADELLATVEVRVGVISTETGRPTALEDQLLFAFGG